MLRAGRAALAGGLLAAALSPAALGASEGILAAPWRQAALFGGDVRSLAIHPADADLVYAGTTRGHVYVSSDGGATWGDVGGRVPFPGWVVSDLVFDAERPGRLWAGLWGLWGGGLVAHSDDGGRSWSFHHAFDGTKVYTLATVAGRPDRLYAGTLNGVYRSDDAGESWRRVSAHLPEIYKVTSLLVGPHPEAVIAGTWQRAYKSADGGATWHGLFDGMVPDSEVFTLRPVPGRPQEIWASTCGWVYRTLDGGARWQRFREGFEDRRTPSFEVLPGGRLLAGTVEGLHVSDDGGAHWRRVGPARLAIAEIAYHPARPERVFLATEGAGVWTSRDGGDSLAWSSLGMTNVRVAALLQHGPRVLAAVNHAGPRSGVYSSSDGGRTFATPPGPLPPVLDLAEHGSALYAATERGLWESRGAQWQLIGEVGQQRVEQVLSSGHRLVARTATGFWELAGARFQPLEYRHAPPRSAALVGEALWVADGEGLYRLAGGGNHTVPTPAAGGRLERLGAALLLWSGGGVWVRGAEDDERWIELAGGAAEVLVTGDPRRAALVLDEDGAALADLATGSLHPLPLPVPPRDVTSVLLRGDRLLLGTAAQGLFYAELAPPPATGSGSTTLAAP
jgi:photosystem II stability/assembly factor-like uncharacterized protein